MNNLDIVLALFTITDFHVLIQRLFKPQQVQLQTEFS
jgi:hypothetical protein